MTSRFASATRIQVPLVPSSLERNELGDAPGAATSGGRVPVVIFERIPRVELDMRALRNTDGLLTYEALSVGQRAVLGHVAPRIYARMSTEQRAVFLLLTSRLERVGADFTGLRLLDSEANLRRNRMLFAPSLEGLSRLYVSLRAGIRKGTFTEEPVSSLLHCGMGEWGVRENRAEWALKIGMGPKGAFVEINHYNPSKWVLGGLGHWAEVLMPYKPNPLIIARALGEELYTHPPASAQEDVTASVPEVSRHSSRVSSFIARSEGGSWSNSTQKVAPFPGRLFT
jgi:hypothetical protein